MHARFPVAVHIFLLRENHVLLLRRANTGYEDGNYSVVAGHLDGGERVMQAAIRETYEEVGVRLCPTDLTVVGVMHRLSNDERIDVFLRVQQCARVKSETLCPRYAGLVPIVSSSSVQTEENRRTST